MRINPKMETDMFGVGRIETSVSIHTTLTDTVRSAVCHIQRPFEQYNRITYQKVLCLYKSKVEAQNSLPAARQEQCLFSTGNRAQDLRYHTAVVLLYFLHSPTTLKQFMSLK